MGMGDIFHYFSLHKNDLTLVLLSQWGSNEIGFIIKLLILCKISFTLRCKIKTSAH